MINSRAIQNILIKLVIMISISVVSHLTHAQKSAAKRTYPNFHKRNIQNPTTTAGSSHESQLALGQELYDPAVTFSAYPNPALSHVQIKWAKHSIKLIEVADINGRLVKQHYPKFAHSDKEEIDLTDFKSGIYFVTAYNLLGDSTTVKIIKK